MNAQVEGKSRSGERRPMLFMSPRTWFDLCEARAVIFLVGGYDGSGNYGDLAQLEATSKLLDSLGERVLTLPIVDLRYVSSHRVLGLRATRNFDPDRVLVFSYPGDHAEVGVRDLGLVPVALPGSIGSATTYLYGGGFLNQRWADRMLKMLDAVDWVVDRAPGARRDAISSGLQIEPDWARGLGAPSRARLARFAWIGVRDAVSAQAAASLDGHPGAPAVLETGDDAVGLIAPATASAARGVADRSLRVNFHICAEPWVTEEPERLAAFLGGLVVALAAHSGRTVDLQPVIAYEDPRLSERAASERAISPLRSQPQVGAVDVPVVLRPVDLDEGVERMRDAELTVACSYHVALTSLLLGVPAVLVGENAYYAQKAAGLRSDFRVPAELLPHPADDPADVARGVLAQLSPSRDRALAGRERVLARRREAEREILGRLEASLEAAGSEPRSAPRLDDQLEALVRACELAYEHVDAYVAESTYYRAQAEHFRELAEYQRELAESRRELAENLQATASWRLTKPLREGKRIIRRRRSG